MPKSYRIRTEVGQNNTNKSINVNIDQDFDFLEILSLKILQSDLYIRKCSDYGVLIGRISVNNGYGVPNAKVSVFIPLSDEDERNPIISELYPYKNVTDLNEDGYRYNLLPYQPSYPGHLPTGTFPDRVDVLTNNTVIELYDKYYKFTVQTNSSGDFMIFGVPVGSQTLVVDIDLSDIGQFSLSPQDLIRSGLATELQVDGVNFKTSENLNSLPQIINIVRDVEVLPLWGDEDTCQASITRTDFDLTDEANIEIKPTAIFMGSLLSTPEKQAQKKSCKVKGKMGSQCSLIAGPGQIRSIRQTIFTDSLGRPALETYNLENNGNVIDDNGTWLTDIPMNLDYVTTNEFGEQVYSNDPKIGIPSTAKYRFKIKWQQSPTLGEPVKRGYFLVPNIRENGWYNSGFDPADPDPNAFPINPIPPNGITFAAPNPPIQPQSILYSYTNNTTGQVVFKITEKLNIASLVLTINGVPLQGDNIILNGGETLNFTPVYDDILLPCSFKIDVITYAEYQVERSYSFSLSWDDYADQNAGINCEDTFYEMKYNKVYTTSQLVDQYRKGFANNKFIGIKEITDDTCDGEVYKFPTNDGVYRNDILYLLFSLMMLIFKPILYVLLIVSHVVAFLLKYVMYPLVIIIAVIFVIVIAICNLISGFKRLFGGKKLNCPDGGDLLDLIKDLLSLWKKMIIRLPNMTYPDCDFCECVDQDAKEFPDDQYQQTSGQLTQNIPSGLPADFTDVGLYEGLNTNAGVCGQDENTNEFWNWADTPDDCQTRLLAAQTNYTGAFSPDASYGGVGVMDVDNPDIPREGWVSTTLPIAERVNLWNSKAKYFSDTATGEGRNRIKVSFQPTSNLVHYDNVTILIIDKNQINSYPQGQLLSFQDPKKSKDVNVFSANTSNGNITGGTSVTGATPYTVNYANFASPGNMIPVPYILNITGNTVTELKFPTDIEYFQVIKSMSLGDFYTQNSNPDPDSFFGRVFNQASYMNLIKRDLFPPIWKNDQFVGVYGSATDNMTDWQSLGVLIMVRGVDPHTPRIDCKYEIGNIFGLSDNAVTITGGFHPNIPIQGNYKCVQHNYISDNNDTNDNNYTTTGLYYPTFNQLNFPPLNFSSYTTNLHSYYVSMSNDGATWGESLQPSTGAPVGYGALGNSTIGRYIDNLNISDSSPIFINNFGNCIGAAFTTQNVDYPTSDPDRSGYLYNEKIEGCSYAHLSMRGLDKSIFSISYGAFGLYHSPSYDRTNTIMTISYNASSKYIMRSDRLPTSTYDYQFGSNYMALQQNPALAVFKFSDEGAVTSSGTFIGGSGFQPNESGDNVSGTTEPGFVNEVLDSFSCGNLVPLGCYDYDETSNTMVIDDPANCQTKGPGNVTFFEDNCYVLVSKPLISLIVDFGTLAEWTSRTKIMFGVCRDVLSHLFTNNWINGSLYAFSFKNDRLFDRNNIPYNKSCLDTVIFHRPTQNYFYRSSPYDGTDFIGKKAPSPTIGIFGSYFGGNEKNLLFPTTIMDLGPRNEIAKYLSLTNEYNGYNVNKIPSTSFGDIDDILNLFIISRLANTSFLGQLLGLGGANILSYFTREKDVNYPYHPGNVKNKRMVDSDYAQLISINSEIGVAPFDSENYPDITPAPPQQSIFFNGGNNADGVIGIFFSSDTQVRDYLSPRRTILSDSLGSTAYCSFEDLPIKTQNVPFYQWNISNTSDPNIFGTQKNYWYTDGIISQNINTVYHQYGYQLQDRLNPNSRYFRGTNTSQTKYYKGYIYSVDGNGDIVAKDLNIQNIWSQNTPIPEAITVGGPFYFYFGLKRGASAMDRFIQKWVDTEYIVD
jgi:hypothetical protein